MLCNSPSLTLQNRGSGNTFVRTRHPQISSIAPEEFHWGIDDSVGCIYSCPRPTIKGYDAPAWRYKPVCSWGPHALIQETFKRLPSAGTSVKLHYRILIPRDPDATIRCFSHVPKPEPWNRNDRRTVSGPFFTLPNLQITP
jgi:hypothetical protein